VKLGPGDGGALTGPPQTLTFWYIFLLLSCSQKNSKVVLVCVPRGVFIYPFFEKAMDAHPRAFLNMTAVGYQAGSRLTNGDHNAFFGSGAGQWLLSGSNNILIGNTDTGKDHHYTCDNCIVIGNQQETVIIGKYDLQQMMSDVRDLKFMVIFEYLSRYLIDDVIRYIIQPYL
jgi:hypothetical protein